MATAISPILAKWLDSDSLMNENHPTYLFLCGVGRSGTTALRKSIGAHPQIYYNGVENNVVQDVVSVALRNCTMPSRKKSMVINQSQYDSSFRELIEKLIWPEQKFRVLPVRMAAINPGPVPLDYMRDVFPNSRYIGLIRNGIEVVSSRMEYRSFSRDEFVTHCEVWNRSAEMCDWGKKNADVFREVRHEWMYHPEKLRDWMNELFSWLSIDSSEVPASKVLETLQHPTSAAISIHRGEFESADVEQKQKYFQSKRQRWRKWTPAQRELFEDLCGENMTAFGYDIPWQNYIENSRNQLKSESHVRSE